MIQKIGNKLQVEIDAGGEKTKKITFTNVMDEPSEEKVLELGEIIQRHLYDKASRPSCVVTIL